MTVAISIAIFATATISATLIALFLNHRWGKAVTRTSLVTAHNEQLKEIEKKKQSRQIDEAQADRARMRILRKLASKTAESEPKQRAIVSSCGVLVIPVISAAGIATVLTTYAQFAPTSRTQDVLASSNQRVSTHAASADQADTVISDLKAYVQKARNSASPMSPIPDEGHSLPSVDIMIRRLATRLERAPGNADDWRMLGWSYFRTNRYREAADAYARAVALRADNASWQSEYGVTLVKSSDGKVTGKAKAVFSEALKLDQSDRVARFYSALAKTQDGDKKGALEDWIALLRDNPDIQTWSDELKEQILALAKEVGADVSHRLPGVRRAKVPTKAAVSGPNAEEIRGTQKLSAEEQSEMIRGMVQRLASRLERAPDDTEGWVRLIRSRIVLQEPEKAQDALEQAINVFRKRPDIKDQILREAKALGVTPRTAGLP